jgi:outer membrane protein OmpA-like peptidoglycan-associated protein
MKHMYLYILLILFGLSITTNAQFKEWGSKFGARYNFLLPQNEFPNVGFGQNDKFSFDNYTMSYLLEGFVGFELTRVLELDINAGYGSYAGYQFDYTGYYKSEIIPVNLRFRIAPFDLKGWNPYLYLGGGIMHYSNKYPEENKFPLSPVEVKTEGWAGLFPLGIGAEFALSDMVLLDFSIGGAFSSSYDLNNYDDGNNIVDATYGASLGLTITGESCSSDRDMDGLGKCEEEKLGTSPRNPDTDGDGLTDGEEVLVYKTKPLLVDTDLDGLSDFDEVKKYKTDPLNPDTDGDGLNDGEEVNKYKTDPLNPDTDNDGLSDGDEVIKYKTDPTNADTDGDGLSDGEEVNTFSTNPLSKDTDGDGLSDYDEVMTYKTNPLVKDTDGGSVDDGTEVARGTNPLDAEDDVVKVGVPIILEGITFATGKADITPESENTLRKALKTLQTYPDITVEIAGYTDNVGSESSNQRLSERRANSVRDWLVRQGIEPSRIEAVGYGESNPVASNGSPEGRQRNRRIEFKRIK